MKQTIAMAAVVLGGLAACGSVQNETRGEIVVRGKTYTTVTRQYDQNGETVTTGSVIFQNRRFGCNTLLPGDCENQVLRLELEDDVSRLVIGSIPSEYVITDPNRPAVRPLTIRF